MIGKIFKYFRRLLPCSVKLRIASLRCKIFNIFSLVIVETSSACNRRCSYCPNSKFDRGLPGNNKKLSRDLFHKIIDELDESRWFGQIQFNFYNEPLLDERLPEFVKYARSKLPTSSIIIYTNGDFLTIELYKRLIESGVTDFLITKHQSGESENINKLLEYRKVNGKDRTGVIYRELKEFTNRGGLVQLSAEDKRPKRCLWGFYSFIVNHEGEAVLCHNDYFNSVELGNLKDENMIDIWNKPHYKQLREQLKRGRFEHEMCKKCALGKLDS